MTDLADPTASPRPTASGPAPSRATEPPPAGDSVQRDLAALEQRWGLALQSAGFGVWDLDVPAQTVHYSPQWKVLLGYPGTDEADSTAVWRARVHPDDLQPMLAALTGHLAHQGAPYEMEFRLRSADGGYRWVLSRGRVVERDAVGRAVRAVGTLTDLSDRREAERLRIERNVAEAASRAKTAFLARMSHELRTPLNAVLGFAQLLSQPGGRLGADDRQRYVKHIEHAGWRLLQMVDDVLELSRVESGQLAVRSERVPLGPVVAGARAAATALAQAQGVTLHDAPLPADAAVQADAARLHQVVGHLLDNAIKYNRRGGTVTVTLAEGPAGWTLTFADTGLGIPDAAQAHLFEPFNRLGRADSGIEGVGIGLVLVRALLDVMGGSLAFQSTEGVGSRFAITLPRADA